MIKRVKVTGAKAALIRSTTKAEPRIDPMYVAAKLGAEHVMSMPTGMSPPLLELRRQLFATLKSRGGRPGLEGTELRPKIPMSADDWRRLEEVAGELAADGFAPTAGQVGAQLLHAALVKMRGESAGVSPAYALASHAREPSAAYEPGATPSSSAMQRAAHQHLEQAQAAAERRVRPSERDHRVTELVIQNLAEVFVPPGVLLTEKGASSPTTSIAVLGPAGAGKTTLALALAHAIARDCHGIALCVTTDVAPTELPYHLGILGSKAQLVGWARRASAAAGDVASQPASLLDGGAQSGPPLQRSALEAIWRLVEPPSSGPPLRCLVIDALALSDPATRSLRPDFVTLIHALEGRGVSLVIVQESLDPTNYARFIADIVFQLDFVADGESGQTIRSLTCTKSRYAAGSSRPHAMTLEDDRVIVRPLAVTLRAHTLRGA